MSIRYYSQGGEDALLWSVFEGRRHGFFIEVGAFDRRHLSNSLSFEEQGWAAPRSTCCAASAARPA